MKRALKVTTSTDGSFSLLQEATACHARAPHGAVSVMSLQPTFFKAEYYS